MGFPFFAPSEILARHDFVRFEPQFAKSLLALFPCQGVQFVPCEEEEGGVDGGVSAELSESVRTGVVLVRQSGRPVTAPDGQTVFLPIREDGELLTVAVLAGSGTNVFGQYSEEWLVERGRLACREFSQIKRWARDFESGVLNAAHLRDELEMLLSHSASTPGVLPPSGQLILIEVGIRVPDARQAFQQIRRTAAYLDSLLGAQAPLHHLGLGVFALIWHGTNLDDAQRLGAALLRKLKRLETQESEPVKFRKVQISITPLSASTTVAGEDQEGSAVERLFDQAWQNLETARKRGAFAISVGTEGGADTHLLAPLPAEAINRLKRLWKGENEFSVIAIQKDIADQHEFSCQVIALAGEEVRVLVLDANRALIYVPGADEEVAAEWACGFANRILPLGIGTFSMGIASHPCPGFHKADAPLNAKKALIHTQFFGAGSITSFSGVSLNISGDIYYNEGDLAGAIREYRLGLNLAPDNVNLLNSLGVIYAQIDDYSKAIPLFEKAIALNHADFMALYNLGFACLCDGDQQKALECFEQAEKIDDTHFELLLQLGQIYCQRGKYKKAVRVLTKAEKAVSGQGRSGELAAFPDRTEPGESGRKGLGHGLVYRYLGEAYKGIGQNREAMIYLQRAARYNSRDSEALSRLGELYATEKQGLDIALAFCRQAVEIEEGRAPYWYRMAVVQDCREEWHEAMESVQRCLALDPNSIDAVMLKASLHEKLHESQLARGAYEKVLRLDGTHARAVKALRRLNQIRRKA